MKSNLIGLLSASPLFNSLQKSELQLLIPQLRSRSCVKNELLFTEGDIGDCIYLIQSGEFSSTVKSKGEEVEVARFQRGDFLGEIAFFDNQPRSASCQALKSSEVIMFSYQDYEIIMQQYPEIVVKILCNILAIIANRLEHSDLFLSDMVMWGEDARRRSITDELTTFHNRRYLDDVLPERILDARFNNEPLSIIMIDIDHFGTINQMVGASKADSAILSLVAILKQMLRPTDIAVRYGGDEFVLILPKTDSATAYKYACRIIEKTGEKAPLQDNSGNSYPITISQGIAIFPDHGADMPSLLRAADDALYNSKENGRNCARVASIGALPLDRKRNAVRLGDINHTLAKEAPLSLVARNRVINNIINAIIHRHSFVVVGHQDEDDDCVASTVAMALLIKKFNKEVKLHVNFTHSASHSFLRNIAQYNGIPNLGIHSKTMDPVDTIVICDVPRSDMIQSSKALNQYLGSEKVLHIEIDHHLGSNSNYSGNRDWCLVDRATSTCELIYILAHKLHSQSSLIRRHAIDQIFSRNIIVTLMVGFLGDTQNGRYLNGVRNRRAYRLYTGSLNRRLKDVTFDAKYAHSSDELEQMVIQMSKSEADIRNYCMRRLQIAQNWHSIILNPTESLYLWETYDDHALILSTMRTLASILSEKSDKFGGVFYDDIFTDSPEASAASSPPSHILHGHLRRNIKYSAVDLRTVLKDAAITTGGGHEGAVAFRFPYTSKTERAAIIMKLQKSIDHTVAQTHS